MDTKNNDHQSAVINLLKSRFGKSLKDASLEEKFLLIEATAFSLRGGITFASALSRSYVRPNILQEMDTSMDFKDANEALHLMGLLNEGIVEDYSVLASFSYERKIG
jgi:hypothetical protein